MFEAKIKSIITIIGLTVLMHSFAAAQTSVPSHAG
jgi:hypothetical protein